MSGTGPAGVGVIGAGTISREYLRNLTSFADVEVKCVADLDLDRAASRAQEFGVADSGTVDQLLARDDIEVVVNLTIPAVHVEVAEQALAVGKHVWSEKPFALERADGQRLLDTAKAAGLRVATAPDTFLGAGIQSALRLLAEGAIGQPLSAITMMMSPGPERWHESPAFLFDIGGGPLFDMGPYYLTALVQFFGPVRKVQAVTSQSRPERVIGAGPLAGQTFAVNVPTHVSALLEFASGQHAQSTWSFDSPLGRNLFEITGYHRTMQVPDPNHFKGDLILTGPDGTETIAGTGAAVGRGTGVVEMVRAIRAGVPERASGDQAFHVLDVMQSIIESGESGAAVEIGSSFVKPEPLPVDWDPAALTVH